MKSRLAGNVRKWAAEIGLEPSRAPRFEELDRLFRNATNPCREGVSPADLASWEERHGYVLPKSLSAWLLLSNGFFGDRGPLIHPLSAIGPMVPFASWPGLVVQPESWFELGNPNVETVCIDLGYRIPGGDFPVFTSGDDQTRSRPRLIAGSFETWFLKLLEEGGREYWFDEGYRSLGDPWREHRSRMPRPHLTEPLGSLAPRVRRMLAEGADDRKIARTLDISSLEVESIVRYLQHARTDEMTISS